MKPILALYQVTNILRDMQIQKRITNGDSTIIICKIRDLTPYASYVLQKLSLDLEFKELQVFSIESFTV